MGDLRLITETCATCAANVDDLVRIYRARHGSRFDDMEVDFQDMISDLMHWLYEQGGDPLYVVGTAIDRFTEELEPEIGGVDHFVGETK